MRVAMAVVLALVVAGCGPSPPRSVTRPDGVAIERGIVYRRIGARELKLDIYRPEGVTGPLPVVGAGE